MNKLVVLTVVGVLSAACIPSPTPSEPCLITPVGPVTAYTIPSAAGDVFGTLTDPIEATAKTADGFYGFDPGVAQAGNSGLYRLRWALKTHDLTTSAGCAGIPTVVGPIAGLCYAMIMTDTPVYSSANTTSTVLTTLHNGDFVMVTAHISGWFTTDLNVGSAGQDIVGHVEEGIIGGVKGACGGL
jgi:hypothetical protein